MKASKDRRAPRNHSPRHLLDYLESRVLLDGNVTASVSAGTLTLQGDNLNNSIIIDQPAFGSFQFRLSSGDASTTINGSASPQTFDNVTNIVINAGSGNDTLTLQNASVAGFVQINGANGNQAVDLNALTVAGDFTLTNTGGQNSTTLENFTTIQGNVIITAGVGFDPTTGSLWASPLFADANQIFTLSNSTVDNAVLISNSSSETTTTIDNNSTINTDLLVSNGNLSYGSMGFNSANSPSPAGDLFILNASTVGDSISITNASNGNATVIEGGSSVTNNLSVSNAGDADCGCMLPGSSDSFTLTDSSSINGDVTLSNTSNGSSILITNFGFIGGSLNVTNTAAATDCPCCTLNYGQPTPSFGDYLTLSDGAFVGADVNISNGSTYNSTDIDSNFIGGNLTLSNGPDFTAATYTTDLFTLNNGFVGGSVSISNAAGDINTTISNTIISVSLSVTNLNGSTFFETTSPTDPTNYQDTEQTAPVPPPPPPLAITTTQQPATVTVGNSIADQATLTGGCDPTGTVTFTLFSNPTASGTPLFTDTETLSNGIATSAAYTTTATGTDYWLATYNGDCMNLSLSTGPADEPVTVNAATPLITTTQQPATVTVGNSIADQATVTAGFNPTGTVTFQLFNNPNATGTALFTDTETLSSGTATSASYTTTATGTDYWVATYNGNTNNISVTSSTAAEPVTINAATPLIATTQQPATITVGNSIADQATVTAGFNPTGTVTFQLYNNPNATGAALFTDTETLSSGTATSASYTTTATGTDYWVATYNGDTNNNLVTSTLAAEPVTINAATPLIATTQQPATITVGNSIADKATVTAGFNPTGTVTFQLYNNPNATGAALFTDTETLSSGTATSASYTTTATGTDYWVATYNGDTNNNLVTSTLAAEPVTINAATPLIATTQQPATITVGNSIADKATVTAGFNPTGTVTFQLYNNPNATGTALFTDTEALASGTATSASYTTTTTGTDYWVATYNGNTNNISVTSGTALEPVTITGAPNVTVIKTADQPSIVAGQTAGFVVTITNNGNSAATGVTLNDPLPPGAGNDINWAIDGSQAGTNPADFTIIGATGSQNLGLSAAFISGMADTLAPGQSISVHITGTTQTDDATTGAGGQASSSPSNFNGTGIAFNPVSGQNNYIWFNSVVNVSGLSTTQPTTLFINSQVISFSYTDPVTHAAVTQNLTVPNAEITFTPNLATATTTFSNGMWITNVPTSGLSGNVFMAGLAFKVPVDGLPGGINPVTWNGSFASSATGLGVQWQWAAAVYNNFSNNYNSLDVKPVDDNQASAYKNSDHAGTPESFTIPGILPGGARGGGGSNWTGSYSGTVSVTPSPSSGQLVNQATAGAVGDTGQPGETASATILIQSPKAYTPTLTTTPGASLNIGSGGRLTDSATLSGGHAETGSITFTLYSPSNVVVDTETVSVNGTGTYTTPTGFLPTVTGTYQWVATYSGDANNNALNSSKGSEPESVTVAAPTLNTTPGGYIVLNSGTTLSDSAALANGFNPTGSITFQLYNPSNALVYTDTVTASGNNTYTTANGTNPGGYLPTVTGTYQWVVTYSGDAINGSAASPLGSEPEIVALTAGTPNLTVTKTPDAATIVAAGTAGFTVTITNTSTTVTATGVTLTDALTSGLGNDITWSIDTSKGNPNDFQITGSVGSQNLTLSSSFNTTLGDSLAPGQSISVHYTGVTSTKDTGASAPTELGSAANYVVLYEGIGGHNLQITNVSINGNVGVAGTGNVHFSGPGTIGGRLDFSATNTNQYSNSNGSNVGPTSVNYSVAAVTSALNTINTLSSSLAGLGSNLVINGTQTINESAGQLDTVNGVTYRIFNVTSYSENDGKLVTINGDGSGDPVVFNFAANSNVNLGGDVNLTGGLTDDQVLWNFTSTNQNIQLNNNASSYPQPNAFRGIILAPKDAISVTNTSLDGRVFGGNSSDMQIVSGDSIYVPTTGSLVNQASVSATGDAGKSGESATAAITIVGAHNAASALGNSGLAYTPAQIRTAYGLNSLSLDGTGQTIAIVTAYDDPAIFQALDTFDAQFGTTTSGPSLDNQYGAAASFLNVMNQNGSAASLPATDPTGQWEVEAALDVEWVHAMAPGARITLVEANSQSLSDLMSAVSTATGQPGVSVVSMSWGLPEGLVVSASDEALYDSYLATPGVTFLASTGDYGAADPEYPAFSPNVVAVGGTSLILNSNNSYNTETGWGGSSGSVGTAYGSGGGTSLYETEPAFQLGVQSTGYRSTPDVSMVADPNTGAWISDPYNLSASDSWEVVGGTSLSAPLWAGLMAVVNQGRVAAGEFTLNSTSPTDAQQALYGLPQSDFNQINGSTRYNMVTGLGSPIANLLVSDLVNYQPSASSAAGTSGNISPAYTGDTNTSPANNSFDVSDAIVLKTNRLDSASTGSLEIPAHGARPVAQAPAWLVTFNSDDDNIAENIDVHSDFNISSTPKTVALSNTAVVVVASNEPLYLLGNDSSTATINFGDSLPGAVFNDADKNGLMDNDDTSIAGVLVTFTVINDLGVSVTLVTTTNASSVFSFTDLRAGTYTLTETQPAGYTTTKDVIGIAGGSVLNDTDSKIVLGSDVDATGYNSGEH